MIKLYDIDPNKQFYLEAEHFYDDRVFVVIRFPSKKLGRVVRGMGCGITSGSWVIRTSYSPKFSYHSLHNADTFKGACEGGEHSWYLVPVTSPYGLDDSAYKTFSEELAKLVELQRFLREHLPRFEEFVQLCDGVQPFRLDGPLRRARWNEYGALCGGYAQRFIATSRLLDGAACKIWWYQASGKKNHL